MILSQQEIKTLCYNAGFRGIDLSNAVKICFCESAFNSDAHNLTANEDSKGLFQINVNAHPEYLIYDLYDPQINCNIAYEIFTQSGKKFTAWKNCAASSNLIDTGIIFGTALVLIISIYYINYS